MRVKIDAGGRTVEIDCADENVTPKDIATTALAVWQATEGKQPSPGPAVGFQASPSYQPDRGVTSMSQEPLRVTS